MRRRFSAPSVYEWRDLFQSAAASAEASNVPRVRALKLTPVGRRLRERGAAISWKTFSARAKSFRRSRQD